MLKNLPKKTCSWQLVSNKMKKTTLNLLNFFFYILEKWDTIIANKESTGRSI
jgi:hypothetical protein